MARRKKTKGGGASEGEPADDSSQAQPDSPPPKPPPQTDEEFAAYVHDALSSSPLHSQGYGELLTRAAAVVCDLRRRLVAAGEGATWMRLMKNGRMLKELNEVVPVAARVLEHVNAVASRGDGPLTIVDLCCGVGYLSILLAELLRGREKDVARFVLVDYAFPMRGAEPKETHINIAHLNREDLWPFELTWRKYDLKKTPTHHGFKEHIVGRAPGPLAIIGVHLCGVLSLRGVQMFNDNPRCTFLALKPCCLPPMMCAKNNFVWTLNGHEVDARKVSAAGRYSKNKWLGPNKSRLKDTFDTWAEELAASVAVGDAGRKELVRVKIVEDPCRYQQLIVFADRPFVNEDGEVSDIGGEPEELRAERAAARDAADERKRREAAAQQQEAADGVGAGEKGAAAT